MVFSSLTFLTIFLPVTCILYFIPDILKFGKHKGFAGRYKNFILLAVSLVFYAWGEPKNIILMLLSILFNFTVAQHIASYDSKKLQKKLLLVFAVVFNIGLLGFFKYSSFIAENISVLLNVENSFVSPTLPIGISFYTFQILSYVIDVYREKTPVQRNLTDFALYVSMFPQLIAGPVVQYSDIQHQLRHRTESILRFADGLTLFIAGLFKKTVLANSCGSLFEELTSAGTGALSAVQAWLAIIFYAFQIYFDFGGYSDMAIGLGNMFGFEFPKNFDNPYIATSITDFWRRWHMTLSSWFRDYLYIPLGGNKCSMLRNIFNLFIVWACTGLWHGASWNFLFWGLYYFALLVLEKYVFRKVIESTPVVVSRIITFVFVLFGWVLFAFTELSDIGGFFCSMFGMNSLFMRGDMYFTTSQLSLLVICGVLSTGVFSFVCKKKSLSSKIVQYLVAAVLLALSAVYLIGDTYNPFLYFRF